jgi:hypothetical protein
MVSVTGIIMNILMLILILLTVVYALSLQNNLTQCLNTESPYCIDLFCPCDISKFGEATGPCFGRAVRDGPNGNFYCSGSITLVDAEGFPVK